MVGIIFNFSIYLFFIYIFFYLLSSLVNWNYFFKVTADNDRKIRLLLLLLSIALGYVTSRFFIEIYEMSRTIFNSTF